MPNTPRTSLRHQSMKLWPILIPLMLLALMMTGPPSLAMSSNNKPVNVDTVKAQRATWRQQNIFYGNVTAVQSVKLRPEITGRITGIFFNSGDKVHEGDTIALIYPDIRQAEKAIAKANSTLSQIQLNRRQQLIQKDAISKAQLDKAQAQYEADQGRLAKQQAMLDQTLVKAPFSGQLGIRRVSLGDMVSPDTTIVEITKRQPIFVDFTVPQLYADKFTIGDTVTVTTDIYPNQTFTGRIKAKQASVARSTRSLQVRAELPNKNRQLIPGSFVQVKLGLGEPRNVLKVPKVALMYEINDAYIYTVDNGHAYKKPVEIIAQRGDDMIIQGDIANGSKVVTGGQIKLNNGTTVQTDNQCD